MITKRVTAYEPSEGPLDVTFQTEHPHLYLVKGSMMWIYLEIEVIGLG